MSALPIGVIGCGNISPVYFRNAPRFGHARVEACADQDMEKARARAEEFGVPRVCAVEELLNDPDIALVLNLTVPKAHASLNMAALEAGKHVYTEKPLATNREEGARTINLAADKGLRVGSAPDTFMGAAHQTCRQLIDEGAIGEPVGATAFMLCHGHESWHPSPEFYYEVGGGPMFDMGPYYLTVLVNLLGPVSRLTGAARATFPERTITSQPKAGKVVRVETPTHIAGVLEFANGAIGTLVTSFDVWASRTPCIEVYGTEGTLAVPDPNGFGGKIGIRRPGEADWSEVPLRYPLDDNARGIGVDDMAQAIAEGRPHRASGALAFHVLDLMQGFLDAAATGKHYVPVSTCERPEPMPNVSV